MNKNLAIIFLFSGLVAGLFATWQFREQIPIVGNFPSDEIVAKKELLKNFLDEQSYLQSKIVSLRKDFEETQRKFENQTETVNIEKLENFKKDIGLSEVNGEGLEILLDDSLQVKRENAEVSDLNLVQASDLRDIINLLYAADAEAISVNNQRVISTSPITSVGTTLLVNNAHIAPPFMITVVGNTDIMLQRLLNKSLLFPIYEKTKKQKIKFELYKKNRVSVPIFNGNLEAKFLNLISQ